MKDLTRIPPEKYEPRWPHEPPIFQTIADRISVTDYTASPEMQKAIQEAAEEPYFNALEVVKELARRDAERSAIRNLISFVLP